MGATWLVAANTIRLQVRNRSVLVLGFAAPLALAFVLNLVFGGIDDPDTPVTFDVGVVDEDGGAEAERFLAVVDDIAGSGLLDLTTYDDEAAGREAVDNGDTGAVWVVPEGFTGAVGSGGEAEITVVGDVDSPTTTSVARAIAERYATGVTTASLAALVAVDTGAVPPDQVGAVAEEAATTAPLARLATDDAGSRQLDVTTQLTAGLALFFVFFTAGMPLLGILEERGQGTLARLLVAPVPAASIVAGKILAAVLLGVVSLVSLMVASTVLMGAEWGSPVGAFLLATAAVIAATGIMGVAAAFARTAEQAGSAQAIVAVVLGILGGTFVPIEGSESGLLAVLQRLTPNGWFIDGLESLVHEGLTAALPAAGVLVATGVVTGAIGLRLSASVLRR